MVRHDDLPKQECMKHRLKELSSWYGDVSYFKSKKHQRFMDFNWYLDAGVKPSSHNWGRKPAWRKKRREQRRWKNEFRRSVGTFER